mgnify:FL=1
MVTIMFNKVIADAGSNNMAERYFKAIFSAKGYLANNRILPTVRIIQNLPSLEREWVIAMVRNKVLAEDKADSILAARILA